MVNPCCNVPEGDVVEPRSPHREGEGAGPPSPGNQPPRAEAPRKRAQDQAGPSSRGGAQGQSTRGIGHAAWWSSNPSPGGARVSNRRIFRAGPQIPSAVIPSVAQQQQEGDPPRRAPLVRRRRTPSAPAAAQVSPRRQPQPGPQPAREPSPPPDRGPDWPRLEDLKDPNDPLIKYGHRTWPVFRPEKIIKSMMSFIWPGRNSGTAWKRDNNFAPRVTRLALEFNQHGLPQTVHADHRHEALQLPPGALNPSWRCSCWRHLLGENWFNDTDSTLLARLGSGWVTEQSLLIHLLTRLITAMGISYRDSEHFRVANPNLPSIKDRWTLENITILKKMMALRGTKLMDGENWELDEASKKLVGELTGIPLHGISRRLLANYKYRYKIRGKEIPKVQRRRESRTTGQLITAQESLYWDEYLLPNRLMNPYFTWKDVSPQVIEHYLKNIHESGPNDDSAKEKIIRYVHHWCKNTKGTRGYMLRQEAYASYNIIARGVGAPVFNTLFPEQNNVEWIHQATEQTLDIRRKVLQDFLSGNAQPSDEEMRADDLLAREIEEALAEPGQEEQEAEDEELVEEGTAEEVEDAQDGSPGPKVYSPTARTRSREQRSEAAGLHKPGSPDRDLAASGGEQEVELAEDWMQEPVLQRLVDLSTIDPQALTEFYERYLFEEGSPYRSAFEVQAASPAGSGQQAPSPLAGVLGFPDMEINVADIEFVTEDPFPHEEFQQEVQPVPAYGEINIADIELVTELPLQAEEFHQQVQPVHAQAGSPTRSGKRALEEEPEEFSPFIKKPRHLDPRLDPGASGSGPRSPPQGHVSVPSPGSRLLPGEDVGYQASGPWSPPWGDVAYPAHRAWSPPRGDVGDPAPGPQSSWEGADDLAIVPQNMMVRELTENFEPRTQNLVRTLYYEDAMAGMPPSTPRAPPPPALAALWPAIGVASPTSFIPSPPAHRPPSPRSGSAPSPLTHTPFSRSAATLPGPGPSSSNPAPGPNVRAWPPEFGQPPTLPDWGQAGPRLDQLHDPDHPLINYGHRIWPIADTQFFISGMMAFVWPGALPHVNYLNDERSVERVTRLVNEFNQYGLPQTVHANIRHETLNPAPEVLNPSWRCSCWRHLLGENWFNDTDATIIHGLGIEWIDDQGILNHLLKRLITAMVNHYTRVTRAESLIRNPNFENPRTMCYRWSAEQIQIYDKMLERRGNDLYEGRNWDLKNLDKKLVSELTGMPVDAINKRIKNRKAKKKKIVEDERNEEARRNEENAREATEPVMLLQEKRYVRFDSEEILFWDEYLLPRKLRQPNFSWADVEEEIKEVFRNNVSKTGPTDIDLDDKIKRYFKSYVENRLGKRGNTQRMAAYEIYNNIAAENNAPPYNPRAINENNPEWITQASNQVLEEYKKRAANRLTKRGPRIEMPTDAEMGDAAQAAQDLEVPGRDLSQVPLDEEGGPQEGSHSPRARAVDRFPIEVAPPRIEHPEEHMDPFQLDPIPQPGPGNPFFDDLMRQLDIAIGVIPPGPPPPSPSPPRGSPAHALSAGSPLGAPAPATSALPSLPPQSTSSPRDSPAHALSAGSRPGAHASSTIPLHDPPAPVAGASAPSPRSLHASSSLSGYAASGSSPDSHVRQPLRGLGSSSLSGYAASGSSPDSHVRQARRAPVRLRPPIQEGLFLQPSSTRTHTTGTSGSRSDPPAMPSLETGAFRALESGPGSSLGLRVNIAAAPEQFLIPDFTNIQIPQTLGLPSIIALSIGGSQTQGSGAQPRTSQSPSLKQKARESAEGSRGSGRAQATTQAQATALVQHSNPDFTQLQVPATQAQGQEEEQLLAHLSSQGSHSEGKAQSPARTPTPTPADAAQTPGTAESQVGPNSQVGPIRVQVEQRRGPPGLSSGSGSDAHNQSQEAGTSGNTPPMIRTEDRGSPVTQAQLANQADGQAEASGILGRISLGTPPVLSNISGIGSMDFDMFDTDNEAQAADQARSQAQAAASNQVQAPETSGRTPPPASHALSMEFFDFDMFEADGGSRQAQVDVVQGMPIEGEEARIEHVDVDVPTNQRARSRSPPAPNRSPAHQRDPPPPTNRSPRR